MPPLSAFPRETQEIVMKILLQGWKNKQERLAREATQKKENGMSTRLQT